MSNPYSKRIHIFFQPEDWLNGYTGKKDLQLYSGTGAGVEYQVIYKVYHGTGVDGSEMLNGETIGKVYCNGMCKQDFSDIRFTHSTNQTPYTYMITSKEDGNFAIVVIKINESLDTDQTITFWYNYPYAMDNSSTEAFDEELSSLIFACPLDNQLTDGEEIMDWSSNELHGTPVNVSYIASKFITKQAAYFDGDSYVTFPVMLEEEE